MYFLNWLDRNIFPQLFGFANEDMKYAASRGCEIVFHHIIAVYEDPSTGVRWFATKGSSNDAWDVGLYVKETLVVGVYDKTPFSTVVAGAITLVASSNGILLLLVPIVILAFFVIMQCLRDVQYAKLEYDVVEEKRKITDEICVKNNIGYRMNTQTKYKVLVQASVFIASTLGYPHIYQKLLDMYGNKLGMDNLKTILKEGGIYINNNECRDVLMRYINTHFNEEDIGL